VFDLSRSDTDKRVVLVMVFVTVMGHAERRQVMLSLTVLSYIEKMTFFDVSRDTRVSI
jgi:hypothetical protein